MEDYSESKLKETQLRLGGEDKIIFILRWTNREMRDQNYRIEVCNLKSTAKGKQTAVTTRIRGIT